MALPHTEPTPESASDLPAHVPNWVMAFAERHPDLGIDTAPDGRWGAATAVFSPGRREHRYLLTRTWDPARPPVIFVMLNPSTADAFDLDPTVRRCAGFAQRWGAGGLIVANIFALRSTDPKGLYRHPDPVGHWNDDALANLPGGGARTVAAWGNHGLLHVRGEAVRLLLTAPDRSGLACLGVTKKGLPRHPLFVPGVTVAIPYV